VAAATAFYGIHRADLLVVGAYLALIIYIGKRASAAGRTQEGFFLAGRKLGKLFQFFLNFGNATDANGAVSTASVVYQQGVSGVWISFQTVFMNPYYWFMGKWFRRVRLVTTADLFEDRLGSGGLMRLYAVFQIGVAVMLIGFGNVVGYKITSALLTGPPIPPWGFYLVYTSTVGTYIVLGGLAAAAVNEALQGVLIVVFSGVLIPFGLREIGGWRSLAAKVPVDMFALFGDSARSRFTWWSVLAILIVSIIQVHAVLSQMAIFGSAKNEFSARFGVTAGTYAKRLMIIMWAFVGLIAAAMFSGKAGLADPDMVWGAMSRTLLAPGILGLMVAGLLAANMSASAAQAVSVSALFVRNLYLPFRGATAERTAVRAGRWAVVGVLALGIAAATVMTHLVSIILLIIHVNVAFGAAIILIFTWRRLTASAVWTSMVVSMVATLVVPFGAQFVPAVRNSPGLLVTAGRGAPVFFETLVPAGPDRPPEGRGRFNFEAWLLGRCGVDVTGFSAGGLQATQSYFDAFLPFFLLITVSVLTPPTARERVDRFYGKLKTPVGGTPAAEKEAVDETYRNPGRFDDQRLFPASSWEFTKWDRTDVAGFAACCCISGSILGGFWLLLRAAS